MIGDVSRLVRITYAPPLLPVECHVRSRTELAEFLMELDLGNGVEAWEKGQYASGHTVIECYPVSKAARFCPVCSRAVPQIVAPDSTPWCHCKGEL